MLWQQVVGNGSTTGIPFNITTSVTSGDALDFVINRGTDGTNYCDSTGFDPVIAHTSTGTTTTGSTGSQNFLLTWDANPEPDIQGYKVFYGTASRNYTTNIDVGNVTSYTVTGLPSGQTYYFAIKAMDTTGNLSVFSNEVNTAP